MYILYIYYIYTIYILYIYIYIYIYIYELGENKNNFLTVLQKAFSENPKKRYVSSPFSTMLQAYSR